MISYVLMGAGIVCLLYLFILLAKGVHFAVVWLPAGLLLLAAGLYLRHRLCNPDGFRLPAPLLVGAGALLAAGFLCFLTVEGFIFAEMFRKPAPGMDVLIVLGAQVKGDAPSLALLRRLEAAEQYLKENPQTTAVLSGGQGDGEDITEAECMYRYLTQHQIEADRLILEDQSTSTHENLVFSAQKIAQWKGNGNGMTQPTAILSNNFHIFRARLLAEKCGYTDVHGIAAASDWRLQIHYLVREFFALIKEKMDGNI